MRVLVFAVTLALLAAPPAGAVVVISASGAQTGGYLEEVTDTEVVIRRRAGDGTEQTLRFLKDKVTVVEAFKPARLEALRPDQPKAYRDYAEELAAKKADPEARDLAVRLFVISAHRDPDGVGRGCLLSAAGAARSPAEERRLRAAAFLLDPQHDRAVLTDPAKTRGPIPEDQAWLGFVQAVRAYRKGSYREAARLAAPPDVAECFARVPAFMSHADFLAECGRKDPPKVPDPSSALVRKILRIELEYEEQAAPLPGAKDGAGGPWARATDVRRRTLPPDLGLETLTEFDPRKCVYKGGEWRVP